MQSGKWKKPLIDWNEYIVLNLFEKAVLHDAGLYKSALRNKQLITFNVDHLKVKSRKH